ncbi:unnamed protein product [Brassicogethes aeneus]|uniref:Vacuolar protein-sorting-associated protein 36 n=1 Tax=Brassicogethes aeneus TaxID=1431903 RepID=A0A9P0BG26_BRAAE|nr:unnamed protein product [Brassicogethes aeneus]
MNRFVYTNANLLENESILLTETNVRLYDGDQKTSFEGGELALTTHRLLWGRPGQIASGQTCLSLNLSLICYYEQESPTGFGFSRSRKILVFLYDLENGNENPNGPQYSSIYNFIKLSFREGFHTDIVQVLNDTLQRKLWLTPVQSPSQSGAKALPQIKLRTGIVGIERSLQEKQKATDESINVAFQDLSKLMTMAKDMVRLTRLISTKIKEKQGDITDDETVQFKSYLLSLGIDDPVTRESYKSDNQYYKGLARQISDFMCKHIEEVGGMMALTDVFCRLNRARGLELLSPEDILNACKLMDSLDLPLKLYQFSSGVMVLQLRTLSDETVANSTLELLEEKESISAEELSQLLGISTTLAKERLLSTERYGKCCRDDSIEGLRFYPNLFLTQE